MNFKNNDPIATAARLLSQQINCFHREATADIINYAMGQEEFCPKDVETSLSMDYRTVSVSMADLHKYGLVERLGPGITDKRNRRYSINKKLIMELRTLIQSRM